MSNLILSLLVAATGWWFFTGVILWLVHQPERYHRVCFMIWTLLLPPMVAAAVANSEALTATSAVLGFTLALVIWGWLEMGYLIGWVTGPSSSPCPEGAGLMERGRRGLATCIYHEMALIVLAGVLAVTTWDAPNPTTLWSFTVLWVMRWSAKLNLVMGVLNYNSNWLPNHLEYLDSYIPRRRMNALFPVSLLGGSLVTFLLFSAAMTTTVLAEQISLILTGALAALGTLEHVFLMLPLRDAALWQWAAPREEKIHPPELYRGSSGSAG